MAYKSPKPTFIYLMRDLRSGYVKIGESVSPKYRETTLQAEQPLIELIDAWEGVRADEVGLHHKYAHKRLRGEWFDLETADIFAIRHEFWTRRRWNKPSEHDVAKDRSRRKDDPEFYLNEPNGAWIDELAVPLAVWPEPVEVGDVEEAYRLCDPRAGVIAAALFDSVQAGGSDSKNAFS